MIDYLKMNKYYSILSENETNYIKKYYYIKFLVIKFKLIKLIFFSFHLILLMLSYIIVMILSKFP